MENIMIVIFSFCGFSSHIEERKKGTEFYTCLGAKQMHVSRSSRNFVYVVFTTSH